MEPRKLTRSQLRPLGQRLLAAQGGVCPLCNRPIDLTVKGDLVLDHDHNTGLIRGALHRACNSGEGRVANAAGRWGARSMEYAAIIPWLERLVIYLKMDPQPYIYPTHQTVEEKRVAANAKARRARTTRQARQVVRKSVIKKDS